MKTKKQRLQKLKTTQQNIQELWDKDKMCNICIMGIAEREEKGKATEETFETIIENFPKLMPGTKPQIQETQRTSSRTNAKITTSRPIIFTLKKIKYY